MKGLGLLAAVALVAVACGDGEAASSGSDGGDQEPLIVFAAASLSDAFAAVERAFEEANPTIDVQLNLAGSSTLREQLLEGAPADVFAPADEANLQAVVDSGLVAPTLVDDLIFARNRMVIAVPAGNEANVTSLEDFARSDLLVGLCAASVPCGRFAREVFELAGIEPDPDTNEPDVRALLAKIEAGELDVGIVYVSDVTQRNVEAIAIADANNVDAPYPITSLTTGPNEDGAALFVSFVKGLDGQAILAEHGFLEP